MRNKAFLVVLSLILFIGGAFALVQNSYYLPAATDEVIKSYVSGDSVSRFNLNADGGLEWGGGSGAVDVLLSRDGANSLQLASGDTLDILGTLELNGTAVTSTAAELNYADVTTLGTVQASKAVTADANLDITGARHFTVTGDVSGDGGDQLFGFRQDQVASTTTAATVAQCGKTFVSNSADVITLPEASTALGCRYTFVCGTADDFDVNPADGTDAIGSVSTTNGTTGVVTLAPSAGDAIRCTDIGGSITLEAVANDLWAQVGGGNGIWTDVN